MRPSDQPDDRADFGSIELHGGGTRVVILPALGGKISVLESAGRDWLWKSDVIPFKLPTDGASYVETADSGGYDECFPTVGPCTLPGDIPGYGGLDLPDHGELWSQTPAVVVETTGEGPRATCRWTGRRMAYHFVREVTVQADGAIVMKYEAVNDGAERLPFLWSAHPLLPITPDSRLVLPDGARVRVWAQHGIDLLGMGAEGRWPRMRVAKGGAANFAEPDAVARKYACKLFLDMPFGRAAVQESDAELEVTWDVNEVPTCGLWLNRRGWTPFRRKRGYLNMAIEPCIGAGDSLAEALGAWRSAHWLEAGEARRWTLAWRGRRLSAGG